MALIDGSNRQAARLQASRVYLQFRILGRLKLFEYLGNAFVGEGKYSEALANYAAAVRIRPNYSEAHHNMGCVLATIGKNDEALEQFNEALRLNGNDAQAHFALGSLLARMGHREEAVAHLTEALRLKPDYEYAKQQLRELGVPVPQ